MGVGQILRERALYASGYLQGRFFNLPGSLTELYALLVAKFTSIIALPLPLLSFLALPLYGGSSVTINLLFFYLTWSALVVSHSPLVIEVYGTLAIRCLCFVIPALGLLAFDIGLPSLSRSIKARGEKQLPGRLGYEKISVVTGVAIFNVLLSVALQALLEQFVTQTLHLRSLLRVTTAVPLPWTIVLDLLKGLVVRGILHYAVHRFLLHRPGSLLNAWHLRWHHSVKLPFSIVAAYDHPINYVIAEFLPTLAPAVLSRWHILTWHLFLALTSLEDLFVYSGYAVLPSSIVLAGMARRTESHFDSVKDKGQVGNFGHIGVLDFMLGTACKGEANVFDDVQDEVAKHQMQQRIEDAVGAALAKRNDKQDERSAASPKSHEASVESRAADVVEEQELPAQSPDDGANNSEDGPPTRRSGRRRRKD